MPLPKSFKSLTSEFKGLMYEREKDREKQTYVQSSRAFHTTTGQANRGEAYSFYNEAILSEVQQDQYQQYGQTSLQQQICSSQQHNQHQQPQYRSSPQSYSNLTTSSSHLPPSWIQQWHQNSQNYYYLDQRAGQTRRDPPINQIHLAGSPMTDYGYPPTQRQNHSYQGGQGKSHFQQNYDYPASVTVTHPGGSDYTTKATANHQKKKKSGSNVGLMAVGADGVLISDVFDAAISRRSRQHDESKSHESSHAEVHSSLRGEPHGFFGRLTHNNSYDSFLGASYTTSHARPHNSYYDHGGAVHEEEQQETWEEGSVDEVVGEGEILENDFNIFLSQCSSLEEAQEEYEEAQIEFEEGNASSSDLDVLEEAEEYYEEDVEEAQEEAEEEEEVYDYDDYE